MLPLDNDLRVRALRLPQVTRGLFAFPAQSNFSGVRHSLDWIRQAQGPGYDVLLDAAALVPTAALSLRESPADFVAISFYKMFGYPTGVGALIARKSALARLQRPWFAGGTVDFVSILADTQQLRADADGFEDGTSNFLALSAVNDGLRFLQGIGVDRISRHVLRLTGLLLDRLIALAHSNGAPGIELYGPADMHDRGGTIAFNLLARDGNVIDYDRVVALAAAARISLRGGCFCNPGAAERAFGYDAATLEHCLRQHRHAFTHDALRRCLGRPVGAVRASLGYASSESDINALTALLTTAMERLPC